MSQVNDTHCDRHSWLYVQRPAATSEILLSRYGIDDSSTLLRLRMTRNSVPVNRRRDVPRCDLYDNW